jgi:hypothetical protein
MAAGQFYLAYVNEGVAFNPAVHNVENEIIFGFTLEQDEGDFAALELEIKNPKIGILNATRKQWAYMSYDTGAGIKALFYGRVVGVPQNVQNETLRLSYIAKPIDGQQQKEVLAEAMRAAGAPYWDGVWFDPDRRNDPDNVLESRAELWNYDRITHVVSATNITNGEDGTLSFSDDEVFYDNMDQTYGEVPLKTAQVTATVNWDMAATDTFDIGGLFHDPDLLYIRSFTGKGLVDRWPKAGANLGNGWKVFEGFAERIDGQGENVYYVNTAEVNGASDDVDNPFTYRPPGGPLVSFPHKYDDAVKTFVPAYLRNWKTQGADEMSQILAVMCWHVKATMRVVYDVSRKYTETVVISLDADVQDVLTDAGGQDVLAFELSSSEIMSPIDPGDLPPIRDVRRRSYFATDRGDQSIQYLIALLRARLVARARCVNITFEIPATRFIDDDVSCRMNASFSDPRLPGSLVAGKIKHYKLELDGGNGQLTAEITIGCSVGKGGTVTADAGTPTYVDVGYVDTGYQAYTNTIVMPIVGEVTYKSINGDVPNDDGMDLIALHASGDVVKSLTITPTADSQKTALLTDEKGNLTGNCDTTPGDVFKRLDGHETTIDLVMKPVTGGPFFTNHIVETSVLKIVKTIDLEAASA